MMFIHQFVAFAVEQEPPIPRYSFVRRMLSANTCRAVGREGIVPAGVFAQLVERTDVFKKTSARLGRRKSRVIKIHIFAFAVIAPESEDVTLICHKVDEGELPVKPADGRITLADFLSRLDRVTKRQRIRELETNDGVGDVR